jgi:2-hydroxychromene-2-carboxylate isomerase
MGNPVIEFIFDFGSPNAYLAYKALQGIAEQRGAAIKLVPCLLGGIFKATNNQGPITAFGNVKGKLAYEQLEMKRFIKKHGLGKFRFNPHFPVNTLLLMRGHIAAQHAGVEVAYVEAGLRAMWEDGKKMDDPDVFAAVMNEGGLDGKALLEKTQDAAVKAELAANTDAAVQRGVFGIPTYFVDGEMFFGKDRLGQVDEFLAEHAA